MSYDYVIELEGLSLQKASKMILEQVDFLQAEGEQIYIVGSTGAGKSTFLKTLYGEGKIASGSAKVLNHDLGVLTQKTLPSYRRKLGMVFQDFNLFEDWTVAENLDFVLRATDWTNQSDRSLRIDEVLKRIGLEKIKNQLVQELSGGQKQMLAIGRSILNKPRLIIADEPTGNLDAKSADQVFYLLHEIAQEYKTALLVATHDYRIIKKFPARVYELNNLKLIER